MPLRGDDLSRAQIRPVMELGYGSLCLDSYELSGYVIEVQVVLDGTV